jgi:hypothetical protein
VASYRATAAQPLQKFRVVWVYKACVARRARSTRSVARAAAPASDAEAAPPAPGAKRASPEPKRAVDAPAPEPEPKRASPEPAPAAAAAPASPLAVELVLPVFDYCAVALAGDAVLLTRVEWPDAYGRVWPPTSDVEVGGAAGVIGHRIVVRAVRAAVYNDAVANYVDASGTPVCAFSMRKLGTVETPYWIVRTDFKPSSSSIDLDADTAAALGQPASFIRGPFATASNGRGMHAIAAQSWGRRFVDPAQTWGGRRIEHVVVVRDAESAVRVFESCKEMVADIAFIDEHRLAVLTRSMPPIDEAKLAEEQLAREARAREPPPIVAPAKKSLWGRDKHRKRVDPRELEPLPMSTPETRYAASEAISASRTWRLMVIDVARLKAMQRAAGPAQ